MRKLNYILISLMILLSLAGTQALAQKFGDISDEEWATGAPEDYPEANVVILFDKAMMEVSLEGISYQRHLRMKVLNKAGVEEAAEGSFGYYGEDKIKTLKAHTITPDGKKHKISKKKFFSKSVGSRKSKTFAFPNVEPGSILEYQYKIFHRRFNLLDPWYFQSDFYTMKSTFRLLLHSGFTYAAATKNIPAALAEADSELDRSSNETTYSWSMENLFPTKGEPYIGCVKDHISSLHCQLVSYKDRYQSYNFIEGWPDLGQYFTKDYLGEYLYNTSALDPAAEGITSTYQAADDRIRAAYDYVCKEFATRPDEGNRYMSHETIGQTVKERFGTSHEKNVLLVELAKKVGLSAWPVLISTRGHAKFNPKIYQIQQFNHIIAYVESEEGGVFLDASTHFCPFGMLPSSSAVQAGFLLDGKRSEIVRIPDSRPISYRMDVTNITIDTEGMVHCSTQVMLSGYYTAHYGMLYESEEPEVFFKEHFLDRIGWTYELQDYSFHTKPDSDVLLLKINYTLPGYIDILDNNLMITPPQMAHNSNPFESETRIFPVDFDYPFTHHNIVSITSDHNLVGIQLPEDVNMRIPGVSYVMQCRDSGNGVQVESKLEITKPVFEQEHYHRLRNVFIEIEELAGTKVILTQGS